ncbi:hypothetical protein [Polycladospora coralii]|nr:hypothetical protein [Polycladospora coralii]
MHKREQQYDGDIDNLYRDIQTLSNTFHAFPTVSNEDELDEERAD